MAQSLVWVVSYWRLMVSTSIERSMSSHMIGCTFRWFSFKCCRTLRTWKRNISAWLRLCSCMCIAHDSHTPMWKTSSAPICSHWESGWRAIIWSIIWRSTLSDSAWYEQTKVQWMLTQIIQAWKIWTSVHMMETLQQTDLPLLVGHRVNGETGTSLRCRHLSCFRTNWGKEQFMITPKDWNLASEPIHRKISESTPLRVDHLPQNDQMFESEGSQSCQAALQGSEDAGFQAG